MMGDGLSEFFWRALVVKRLSLPAAEADAARKRFIEIYRQSPARLSHVYPGIRALLNELRARGVHTAVCTNKIEHIGVDILDIIGKLLHVAVIVDAVCVPGEGAVTEVEGVRELGDLVPLLVGARRRADCCGGLLARRHGGAIDRVERIDGDGLAALFDRVAHRQHEDVVDYCTKHNLAFIPWFPVAAGKLARPGGPLDAAAKKHDATTAQLSLAWLLHRSPVILPIPGTSSVKHLEENIAAASLKLDANEWKAIEADATKK